jgi:hypothetical protein
VAVFFDTPLQPAWIYDAFARVAAAEFATLAVLGVVGTAGARPPWVLSAYSRLDHLAFGRDPAEPRRQVANLPHERWLPCVSPAELHALRIDVAFAVGEFDDTVLDGIARYGVWRFLLGTRGCAHEWLAGWREVARAEPLTASGLTVRLSPGTMPRLAYESWSRTYPLSLARNRAEFLHKTAEFAYRALHEVHRAGPVWLESRKPGEASTASQSAPGNASLAGGLAGLGARLAKRAVTRALNFEQWFLAFRFGGTDPGVPPDLDGFTRVVPPGDRDWADPFALEVDGRHYVFFEELPYEAGKAHISVIEVQPGGRWSAPVRVLERDYHLSYPFLFRHEDRLYMIPETAQSRSVELYRCVEFPQRWRLEKVLIEGLRCVDATLHQADDIWWMFTNVAAGESRRFDDELHLFHAAQPFGPWQAHPANPIKSDVRGARPAGALYRENGMWHRPAQICVPRYGAGLSINRVQRLTRQEYAESEVQRVVPHARSGLLGLHTVNRAGALTVVDAFTRRRRFSPFGGA